MSKKETIQSIKSPLKVLIRKVAADIVPQSVERDGYFTAYSISEDLKYSKVYFWAGEYLTIVFDDLGIKEEINELSAQLIFDILIRELYARVTSRGTTIEDSLAKYLIEDDYEYAAKRLKEILTRSKGVYKVILLSSLIELVDIDSLQIGNVEIKRLTSDYFEEWSEKIAGGSIVVPYVYNKDFSERYEDCVALETTIEGYHVDNEKSKVFDLAISNIKQMFAFLYCSKTFLSNKVNKYELKTTETKTRTLGGDNFNRYSGFFCEENF